jgi:Icc-related predicted phosphoesterase
MGNLEAANALAASARRFVNDRVERAPDLWDKNAELAMVCMSHLSDAQEELAMGLTARATVNVWGVNILTADLPASLERTTAQGILCAWNPGNDDANEALNEAKRALSRIHRAHFPQDTGRIIGG